MEVSYVEALILQTGVPRVGINATRGPSPDYPGYVSLVSDPEMNSTLDDAVANTLYRE